MEDISIFKQKIFELKQCANAILDDVDKKLAEERVDYEISRNEISEIKDKEIDKLNSSLSSKDNKIKLLEDENRALKSTLSNIEKVIGSAIEICEGVE